MLILVEVEVAVARFLGAKDAIGRGELGHDEAAGGFHRRDRGGLRAFAQETRVSDKAAEDSVRYPRHGRKNRRRCNAHTADLDGLRHRRRPADRRALEPGTFPVLSHPHHFNGTRQKYREYLSSGLRRFDSLSWRLL